MVNELKKVEEFNELVKEGTVVVDFNASWCGPCRMLKPVFEEASEQLKDVKFVGVDVDNFNSLAAKFNVRSVPTLVLLQDGNVKKIDVGYKPLESLINFITK